jgi:hypothetical protein
MTDDLDTLTGQVFATEKGKEWLRRFGNRTAAHKTVCRDIEARVARERKRWGDLSSSPLEPPLEPLEPLG